MQQQYSDNPLDRQFRDKLSGSSVQPRSRVWNRITDNLDQGSRKTVKKRLFYISFATTAAAAIMATILFVPGLSIQSRIITPKAAQVINTSSFNKEVVSPSAQLSIEQGNFVKHSLTRVPKNRTTARPTIEQLSQLTTNIQSTLSLINNVTKQADNISNTDASQHEDMLALSRVVGGLQIASASLPHLTEVNNYTDYSNNLTTNELTAPKKPEIQPSVCVKGLYGGINGVLNNTWLIDKKALANYDFKYNVTLGKALAVKVGYNFSNYIGIESGYYISEEGQDYIFSPPVFARVEPSNLDNRIKLTYSQIPLLAKFKFAKTSGLTHHTVALNISAGAEYGFLHAISNTVDKEDAEYANFKKSELAIVGGVGYDIYLSSKIFISTGIQASYSSSLYNNTPVSPYDQFSAPHSLVGGVYLGINYAITGCH